MTSKEIGVTFAVVLGVILFVPALTMSIWGFGMMSPGMMGGWGPLALILLLGLALLTLTLTRRPAPPDPLDELKRRLARGEVTKEQYEELRQILS